MALIFFALLLIAAAILFPDGTRAFITFTIKATVVAMLIAVVVGVIIVSINGVRSEEPVKKVSAPTYHPASSITLDDGTVVPLMGGWATAGGDFIPDEEEPTEDNFNVRLRRAYEESLAAIQK